MKWVQDLPSCCPKRWLLGPDNYCTCRFQFWTQSSVMICAFHSERCGGNTRSLTARWWFVLAVWHVIRRWTNHALVRGPVKMDRLISSMLGKNFSKRFLLESSDYHIVYCLPSWEKGSDYFGFLFWLRSCVQTLGLFGKSLFWCNFFFFFGGGEGRVVRKQVWDSQEKCGIQNFILITKNKFWKPQRIFHCHMLLIINRCRNSTLSRRRE